MATSIKDSYVSKGSEIILHLPTGIESIVVEIAFGIMFPGLKDNYKSELSDELIIRIDEHFSVLMDSDYIPSDLLILKSDSNSLGRFLGEIVLIEGVGIDGKPYNGKAKILSALTIKNNGKEIFIYSLEILNE